MTTETKETIGALGLLGLVMVIGVLTGIVGHASYLKRQETLKTQAVFDEAIAKGKRENEFNEFLANRQVFPKIHALEARLKALETPAGFTNPFYRSMIGDLVITNLLTSTNIYWFLNANTNVYLNTR